MAFQIKWIKIVTNIFDDEKILLIESLPDADGIIVIWFKLLCLAGKQNNNGVFIMGNGMAYTDEMLATIFRRKESIVKLALATFERFGMIEIIDNQTITIPNWNKHQSLDGIELKREYQREYMSRKRQEQKKLASENKNVSTTVSTTVVQQLLNSSTTVVPVSSIEREREIEKELEREIENKDLSKDKFVDKSTIENQLMILWNDCCNRYGFNPIRSISPKRKIAIKQRQKENPNLITDFEKALDYISVSDFCRGNNERGWTADFDWIMKPDTINKILEGKYNNQKLIQTTKREVSEDKLFDGF